MADQHGDLTLDQQIGQLFMVGFPGASVTDEIRALIVERHVGGVVLFTRNIRDVRQTAELTDALQQLAYEAGHPAPLLISVDQENGIVRRLGPEATAFPGNMALGATGSAALTREVAEATGQELLAHGINMNLAPSVDVNSTPANPVIGVRSFGERAEDVARLGVAAVEGYRAAGVASTLKHFPGHGDTAVDSHLDLPVLPYALQRLDEVELLPFRAGIAAGAPCIMTAHVALPALTAGELIPAAVSGAVVHGLLRERLGFDGVVMTDCLEMQAISDTIGIAPAAVMALAAGNDLVLISHLVERQLGGIEAVRQAVRTGTLEESRIAEAAARVIQVKRRYLHWDAGARAVVGSAAHRELADRAYARSVTLVRDPGGLIPLDLAPQTRLVVLAPAAQTVSQAVDLPFTLEPLVHRLRQYQPLVSGRSAHMSPGVTLEHLGLAPEDVPVLVTVNAYMESAQAEVIGRLARSAAKVIGIVAGNPYDAALFPDESAVIATYEYSEPALVAAAEVLFGHVSPVGHLPVTVTVAGRR
jgi:beta-N-acetylhexosaminidase